LLHLEDVSQMFIGWYLGWCDHFRGETQECITNHITKYVPNMIAMVSAVAMLW